MFRHLVLAGDVQDSPGLRYLPMSFLPLGCL